MDSNDSYYNNIANSYNSLYEEEQNLKLNLVFDKLRNTNFFENINSILDIGCGTGVSSKFFIDKGFDVFGIDPSDKLLEIGYSNGLDNNKFLKANAEKIPFEDNVFDLIISFTAIQNFEDIEKGLKEIKRVGKNKFILTFLNGVKKSKEIEQIIKELFEVKINFIEKDNFFIIYN